MYLLSFEVRIKKNWHYLLKMAIWIRQIAQFIVFFYMWQNSVAQLLFINTHSHRPTGTMTAVIYWGEMSKSANVQGARCPNCKGATCPLGRVSTIHGLVTSLKILSLLSFYYFLIGTSNLSLKVRCCYRRRLFLLSVFGILFLLMCMIWGISTRVGVEYMGMYLSTSTSTW